jgi:hypothetical protein
MMSTFSNKHGIECVMSSTGTCFSHLYVVSPKTGKRIQLTGALPSEYWSLQVEWVCNDRLEVPVLCLDCAHYDAGEYGDFGDLIAGPICGAQIYFPTQKGQCKRWACRGTAQQKSGSQISRGDKQRT